MIFKCIQVVLILMLINSVVGEILQLSSRPINMSLVLRSVSTATITGCQMECSKEDACHSTALSNGENGSHLHTCHLLKKGEGFSEDGNLMMTIEEIGLGPRVNGQWGCWRNISACNVSCGGGVWNQSRDCDSPKPENGGDDCIGPNHRTVKCNEQVCPAVNGNWSPWSDVSACTATCGGGTLTQRRECDSPKPQHGGVQCSGGKERAVPCNAHVCPAVNVALNKLSKQSSSSMMLPSAEYGNDGSDSLCAITLEGPNPWWEVDLLADYKIKYIVFYADPWSFQKGYYKNMVVKGKKAADGSYRTCKDLGDLKKVVVNITCDAIETFRYVRVERGGSEMFSVCELEVYAKLG